MLFRFRVVKRSARFHGRVQPAQRGHAHVEEGTEEYVRRDLQQLHGREIAPLDGDLDEDEHRVHKEGEAAEAQREAQTEHVRQARDLRCTEAALRDEGDAERVDEQTEREKEVAQGNFFGVLAAGNMDILLSKKSMIYK